MLTEKLDMKMARSREFSTFPLQFRGLDILDVFDEHSFILKIGGKRGDKEAFFSKETSYFE